MNKKRIISWSTAVVILILSAIYNLSMLTIKTQEVEAQCVRFWLADCSNSSSCCGANMVTHVYTGNGAYSGYFSFCASSS